MGVIPTDIHISELWQELLPGSHLSSSAEWAEDDEYQAWECPIKQAKVGYDATERGVALVQ